MGVTDSLQKAHTMSGGLLSGVDRGLLGGNDRSMQCRCDQTLARLSRLCLNPTHWTSYWSSETAHLVFYRSMLQEVLRQYVWTVE